jgi:hypothetical protein
MGYSENTIYDFMEISLHYGSIWLEIGIVQQSSLEVSYIKFENIYKIFHGIHGKIQL